MRRLNGFCFYLGSRLAGERLIVPYGTEFVPSARTRVFRRS